MSKPAENTYIVVRYLPAFYTRQSLPSSVKTHEDAEKHACNLAHSLGFMVCLVWGGKQFSWVNKSGAVYARTEATD